jgi:cell wall-associated NlpC family hydrolase
MFRIYGAVKVFAVDCSGFTQLVYKVHNIKLPRDTYQQAEVGEALSFVEESKPGDLAFLKIRKEKLFTLGLCSILKKLFMLRER